MSRIHLGDLSKLDAGAAYDKMNSFAKELDPKAKVRAGKKGIYGSTKQNLFHSKASRQQRREKLQTELRAIGEQCFGKGSLMNLAWTSHVNRAIATGQLNTSVEFRGADFQQLVESMKIAYDMSVDAGQITPAGAQPASQAPPTATPHGVGKPIPFQFGEMANVDKPLPFTAKDGQETLAWLDKHADDRVAVRETGLRTYEFYVDTHGDVSRGGAPGDPAAPLDVVKERANAGRALHYLGHSARVDTLRTKLPATDDPAERSRLKQRLDHHIGEYCDPYPMNQSFDDVAQKRGLARNGVTGADLAKLLRAQLGE